MNQHSPSRALPWYGWLLLAILSPVILALGLILIITHYTARIALYSIVWIFWCARGRNVLFVYSDSSIWKEHIESEVIPQLADRAIILNWSRRKEWRFSIATLVFQHFAGSKEFNPMAIVFRPFRSRVEFRFWKPFQAWKKNKRDELNAMERSLFELSGRLRKIQGESGPRE